MVEIWEWMVRDWRSEGWRGRRGYGGVERKREREQVEELGRGWGIIP